jgi:hypothetical protein
VITAAHSRFITGRMIPTRKTEDLLLGSWELIRQLGRVPRRLIWDNESGIGRGGKLADGVSASTETLATQIVQLRPRDPESKGIVERRNGFFETSFMPGRAFASPADFNAQSTQWLDRANSRVVRTLRARPADLIEADRAAMLPLPATPPQLGWQHQVRLGRDYYVRLDASDYSVDPAVIGRVVDASADLERVRAHADGRVVADHTRYGHAGGPSPTPAMPGQPLINPSCASRAGAAGGDPQTAMAGVRAAADSPVAASRCLSRSRSWAPAHTTGRSSTALLEEPQQHGDTAVVA